MREGYHEASVSCAICLESLDHLTIEERAEHYSVHFDDDVPSSSTAHTVPRRSSPGPGIAFKTKENVFWHALQETPPPGNWTPGLIPLLKRTFTKLHSRGITARAVLCTDGVCHVGTEFFDLGWGCGYRNFLMACTSLLAQQTQPMYFPLLDVGNGSSANVNGGEPQELGGPGVRALQAWIEDAWRRGFDEEGAKDTHMKGKLVNTKKWIGTTDIYVAFISRGIPALLVDFPKPQKGRASKSPEHTPASALTRWIVNYFDDVAQPGMEGGRKGNAFDLLKGGGVIVSNRMPIILQHAGHSRTIVGYEKTRNNSINLLLLDPSKHPTGLSAVQPSPIIRRCAVIVPVKRVRGAAFSDEEDDLGLDEKLILEQDGFIVLEDKGSPRTVSFTDTSRHPRTTADQPSHSAGTPSAEESAADRLCDGLDPLKTANFFRVNIASLSQKDQYQILYFPLTEPLTEYQQLQRMVVRSSIIAPNP
ncbi:hypothetical protein BS47DRAFT_1376757 [Hydnum rufescens UP504]|uniref:UFSP1/2/DUB catalytic domain-containing protein n=1 Tax=Hydnum rufescens UP504 TaxID=1448309 RepID=A0A9P6DW41_9AGAM|nr:hypothetical protein BS47DRAFT_1376757 [Hydnum rufescens UP504]